MAPSAARPAWVEPDRPRLTRSGLFLLGAVLSFPIVAAFVALAAPRLALLQHRTLPVLTANHLATLGWGTMIAIGALHQLLPAAAGVRRDPGPEVTAQFALHVLGVILLAGGFWTKGTALLITGGSAVVASILITLTVTGMVVRRRTRWSAALSLIAAAVGSLGLVVLWGLLLALNWRFAFWPALLLPAGVQVHLALGLGGWFGMLIAGASYYLLPRFAGMKTMPPVRPGLVLAGLTGGIAAVIVGAFGVPLLVRVGLGLIGAAGGVYTRDISSLLRAWRTRAPDLTRTHWQIVGVVTAVLSAGAILYALGVLPDRTRWLIAGVTWFLLGWVTLTITGQAYKVTPFLMWHYRFALGMPALQVPRLDAPYWPRAGVPTMLLLTAGGVLISLGALLGQAAVGRAGGALFFAGACAFSYLLGYSWLPVLWKVRGTRAIPAPPG